MQRPDAGRVGVLCLHGFTSEPSALAGLAAALVDAGYAVDVPLLPGHGGALDTLLPTRWEHLLSAADEAWRALAARCERVVVLGASVGGALACSLALRHSEIAGLVLINPVTHAPAVEVLAALRAMLAAGAAALPPTPADIADPDHPPRYDAGAPIEGVLSIAAAVDTLPLDQLTVPVLLFCSRVDHVLDRSHGDRLVTAVRRPVERIWLERSWHAATVDCDAPRIATHAAAFVAQVSCA